MGLENTLCQFETRSIKDTTNCFMFQKRNSRVLDENQQDENEIEPF